MCKLNEFFKVSLGRSLSEETTKRIKMKSK